MSEPTGQITTTDSALMGKLPDFIIVGAQKCGTTSLVRNMAAHPDIHFAEFVHEGAATAETYFFWYPRYHRDKGIEFYKQLFRKDKISGEKTPDYMISKGVMERIALHVPDTKIIVCLRCPVKRFMSEFNMRRRRRTWLKFEEVLAEKLTYDDYVGRGFYAKQIEEHVLPVYPRERVLMLVMDEHEPDVERENAVHQPTHGMSGPDTASKQTKVMEQVYRFLGVEPIAAPLGYHFVGDYRGFSLTDEQLARLREIYREPNERLFALLGRRITTWL